MSNNQSVVYKVVGVNGIVFPKVSHPTELELEYSKTLPLEVVTLITRPERNTVDVEIIGSDNSTIKVLTYSPKSDAPVIIFLKSYPIRNNKVILRTFTHRVEPNTIKEILACISMLMKLTVVDEVAVLEGSLSAVVFSDGEVLPDTSNGVSFSSEISEILRFRVGISKWVKRH